MRKCFILASLLILFIPSLVSACTCAHGPGTCNQGWKSGEVIFTGKVTSKFTVSTPNEEDWFARNGFQFSVSEGFRGSAIAGQEMTIYTGMGGGDCGYQFAVGTSYLVHASLHNGKLFTSICTPTSPVSQMRAIIRQLRALQRGEQMADLFGMIATSSMKLTDDPLDIKPLADKRVRVIGNRNLEQSTTTDGEGVYSFQDLPEDTYRIEVDPPAGMSTRQRNKGESYKVEIGAKGVSGCPANLTFSVDGRIKGRVVDAEGNGVAGFVTLELVDEKEAEVARWRGGTMGYTTESGDFELWLLRPTRYRLLFHPKIGGQVSFRVPPVKSEIISVGVGQHIENFRFKVPAVRR